MCPSAPAFPSISCTIREVPLPNGAVRRHHVDVFGRVRQEDRADGTWVRFAYDGEGHVRSVEHSSGERVDYEVDGAGRTWRARRGSQETTIRLEGDGLPVEVAQQSGEHRLALRYRRDRQGRAVAWGYPDGNDWLVLARGDGGRGGGGGGGGGDDLALRSGSTTYARVRAEVGGTMAGSTLRVAFATGATTTERVVGGRPPRLVGTEAGDAGGTTVVAHAVDHDAEGRVSHLDRVAVVDDPTHRLAGIGDLRFEYDGEGRLATGRRYHGALPMVTSVEGDAGHAGHAGDAGDAGARFDYDADGRRVARHDGHGTTRYRYDLFDQLAAVERPDGARVSYHYDGFGRLVGRTEGTRTVHYLVGIDGHRMAEADGHGRVIRSYLWLGDQCVARVDGPVGGPLAATFHRGPCGRPAAVGDAEGRLTAIVADDPFGADCAPVDGEPGFGGLFGDPATGLLHASSRWLDPASAQFLTPDTWFGEDAARRAPAALRRGLDHLPGGPGTAVGLTPAQAYAWCGYDPLNAVDPTGHNWFGLIFTTISSLLWGMQATSLALEMWVIDFILDIIQVFPLFRPAWDKDGYWETSFYNMAAPTASYRLMVPFAFWFNGLLRGPRAFTMGNIVWAGANSLRDLETTAARDVVKCPEIATTVTATTAAAAGMVMRARNPGTLVTGSVAAATLDRVTGGAVGAPAGAPLVRVLAVNDVVAVKIVGATTDELRQVTGVGPPIVLDRALPAAFGGRNVEVRRLDPGILRLTNGDASLARTVALVRGQTAHFATQVPEKFFASDTVTVDEFLPSGAPLTTAAAVAAEQIVVNLGAGAGLAPYVTGDAVRILSGGTYFARAVEGTRAPESLVLDVPLPAGLNTGMEVARLVAGGGSSAGQTSTGDRVTLGPLTAVSAREGLAITNTGAPVATVQRRIVLSLLLDCTIAPLPASMQGVTVSVAALTADPGTTADGKVAGTKGVTTTAGGAARFSAGQAVEVKAKAGGGRALAIVQSANLVPDTLSFAADLAGLADGTAVTVTLLASSPAATFQGAGPVAAPGDHVVLRVPSATAITANQVLQVGSAPFGSALGAGQLREVTAAPVLLAELDSALPASHTANLSVERLTVDASSVRTGASAPLARIRVTVGAANPFAVGNIVHILDTRNLPNPGQEIVGEIATIEAGGTLVLKDPTTVPLSTSVIVQAVTATGITGSGTLGESKVMIPSDPGEDPLTRRQALQNHEMRHVFQYAIWGPFFLSLPITWLVNVGFSFTKMNNSASKVLRHISVGGLDSLFALLFWGIGGHEGVTELNGTISADRTTVQFAGGSEADKVAKFEPGSRIDLEKNAGDSDYQVVDTLDPSGSGSVKLRFPLDADKYAAGDAVKLTVSAFEKVRKTVSTFMGLQLEHAWHDHIPTAWGRALSGVLDRDNWFPGLGVYVLSVFAAGFDQSRTPFEQDAAYHSGDLYTTITTSDPQTVFVGQFTRVFAFVNTRFSSGSGQAASDIAEQGPLGQLTVELEGGSAVGNVVGTDPAGGAGRVQFRENWYLPLRDEVGNSVGALMAATTPGTYRLHCPGELTDDGVVMAGAAAVGALATRRITVRALTVTPDLATQRLFETEVQPLTIAGDPTAQYGLRYADGAASGLGTFDGLSYRAPVLASGTTASQAIEITATYPPEHPVFRGGGQLDRDSLLPEQRTNLCQRLTVNVDQLTLPAIGPVVAGSTTDVSMPIAPTSVTVGPPSNPAAVTGTLRVVNLGGRPARLQVHAPAAVTAAVDFTLTFVFGADPAKKSLAAQVKVTPAP